MTLKAKKFYAVKEVADILNLKEITIRKMLSNDCLPYYKFEGAVRIDEDDLIEYIEKAKTSGKKEKKT